MKEEVLRRAWQKKGVFYEGYAFSWTTTTPLRSSKDATNIAALKPTATRHQEQTPLPSAWRAVTTPRERIVKPERRLTLRKKANASASERSFGCSGEILKISDCFTNLILHHGFGDIT